MLKEQLVNGAHRAIVPRPGARADAAGTRFTVFSNARRCSVRLLNAEGDATQDVDMTPLGANYFETWVPGVQPGALYYFVLDGRQLPDPYARSLPQGVHGPAAVTRARRAEVSSLPRRPLSEFVIYELHVGTFTPEGTFTAAKGRLPELIELGITAIELMPIAAFAGARGWGYDGVALFAPHVAYGSADELASLLDEAHRLGLSVLLDVVYNHFGPAGSYLGAYSDSYFRHDRHCAWGKELNYLEPALRELVLENARYWFEDFGFDGLRLDATHAIVDDSPRHILSELSTLAKNCTPPRILIAEDDRNDVTLVSSVGLDAIWADDFHHQLHVTLTAESDGYYAAYQDSVAQLAETIRGGWLYSGQINPNSGKARGSPTALLPATAFVYCLQNHDQVGNRAHGDRLTHSISPHTYAGVSLLLLFLPMTPLLFMGQEWGATTPFLYFTDHEPDLGRLVTAGRRREFAAFSQFTGESASSIPDPQAFSTYEVSKLNWTEREQPAQRAIWSLYQRALELRRVDPVLRMSTRAELRAFSVDDTLVVYRTSADQGRTLILHLGREELALETLLHRIALRDPRTLLSSSEPEPRTLSYGAAVVLAGTMANGEP